MSNGSVDVICPNCHTVTTAEDDVMATECHCGYLIGESEWQPAKDSDKELIPVQCQKCKEGTWVEKAYIKQEDVTVPCYQCGNEMKGKLGGVNYYE